jgi:hypothetical protein
MTTGARTGGSAEEREIVAVAGVIRRLARETATPSLYVLARHWWRDREARPAIVTAVRDHIAATRRDGAAAERFAGRARRAVWRSEAVDGFAA